MLLASAERSNWHASPHCGVHMPMSGFASHTLADKPTRQARAEAAATLLNRKTVTQLVGLLGSSRSATLYGRFLSQMRSFMTGLAVTERGQPAMVSLCHRLRGPAAMLGFAAVEHAVGRLETRCAWSGEDIEELADILNGSFAELKSAHPEMF